MFVRFAVGHLSQGGLEFRSTGACAALGQVVFRFQGGDLLCYGRGYELVDRDMVPSGIAWTRLLCPGFTLVLTFTSEFRGKVRERSGSQDAEGRQYEDKRRND
jgi:hypothetical protein